MQDARQSNPKHPDMPDHSPIYSFAWEVFSKSLMLRPAANRFYYEVILIQPFRT